MKKEMIRLLALQAVVTAGFFVPCLRAQSLGAQHREAQQEHREGGRAQRASNAMQSAPPGEKLCRACPPRVQGRV